MNESTQLKTFLPRKLLVLYIIITLLLLIFISASLLSKNWVYTSYPKLFQSSEKQSSIIDLSKFSGGLDSCDSGCSDLSSYSDLKSRFCKSVRKNEDYEEKSLCKMFTNLLISGRIKNVSDILTTITLIFLLTLQLISFKKVRCGKIWGGLIMTSFIASCVGTFSWFFMNSFKASDCSKFPDDGSIPQICMSFASFAAAGVLTSFFLYLVIFLLLRKKFFIQDNFNQVGFTNISYQIDVLSKMACAPANSIFNEEAKELSGKEMKFSENTPQEADSYGKIGEFGLPCDCKSTDYDKKGLVEQRTLRKNSEDDSCQNLNEAS